MTLTHSTLTTEHRQAIEAELTKLTHDFIYYLDTADFEPMIALLTPDAVLDRAGNVHRGHDEVREAMAQRPQSTTRHLLSNFHYRNVTADSAEGVVCALVFHGPPSENGETVNYGTEQGRVIEFTDKYVRTPDGWRIASRIAHPIFAPKVWP